MRKSTIIMLMVIIMPLTSAQQLQMTGIGDYSYEELYNELQSALTQNQHVVMNFDDGLWVPWYKTSSNARIEDLQDGISCNNEIIDYENNCMVSDELSQLGIILAMGDDENMMQKFVNTLNKIKSTNGILPSWRILRKNNQIFPCDDKINGNCDTASDATARIIVSLYAASVNEKFSNQQEYKNLADQMAQDMLTYEVVEDCKDTIQGRICYWLAAGSEAKKSGLSSTDFAYTGYFPDGIIAMLMACHKTGQSIYCDVARDFTKNYLLASNFDGQTFSTPPGRSFKWINSNSQVVAQCTNTCSPEMWDGADAPRALALCGTQVYADKLGIDLGLENYCNLWSQYNQNPQSVPIQFYSNGNPVSYSSGYFAQGLQSMSIYNNNPLYEQILRNALSHYNPQTKTWDYQPVFGIYHAAIPFRSLGEGLGRLTKVFENNDHENIKNFEVAISVLGGHTITNDRINGECREIVATTNYGNIQVLACKKETGVEVYRQEMPNTRFTACFGNGCIDEISGFAIATKQYIEETQNNELDLSTYPYTINIQGGYTILRDETTGDCRTIESNTNYGIIKVLSCIKNEGNIELYRQEYPDGVSFSACLNNNCVNELTGFAII